MPNRCAENAGVFLVIFVALSIISLNTYELVHDFDKWTDMQKEYSREQFLYCIAPSIAFRISYTIFALLAALFCFVISITILVMRGERLDKCIKYMLLAMYVIFGPIMLVGCVISSIKINRLFYICKDNDPKQLMANYSNLLVILVSSAISFTITIAYLVSYIASWLSVISTEQNSWFASISRCYWRWRFEARLRRYV